MVTAMPSRRTRRTRYLSAYAIKCWEVWSYEAGGARLKIMKAGIIMSLPLQSVVLQSANQGVRV